MAGDTPQNQWPMESNLGPGSVCRRPSLEKCLLGVTTPDRGGLDSYRIDDIRLAECRTLQSHVVRIRTGPESRMKSSGAWIRNPSWRLSKGSHVGGNPTTKY